MSSPTIDRYMTTFPVTVEADCTVAEAERKMQEHSIHHLPVLDHGKLAGVLSDWEAHLIRVFRRHGFGHLTVSALMTEEPFVVAPDKPLDETVSEMIARHCQSVVVMKGGQLLGIFTGNDALGALDDALHQRLSP